MNKIPFKCPVCEGRGIVPAWFYILPPPMAQITAADTGSRVCRPCGGMGVLWGECENLNLTACVTSHDQKKTE